MIVSWKFIYSLFKVECQNTMLFAWIPRDKICFQQNNSFNTNTWSIAKLTEAGFALSAVCTGVEIFFAKEIMIADTR
jgi:hypothetical protein